MYHACIPMTQIHKRTWVSKDGKTRESYRVAFRVKGKRRFKQFPSRSAATVFVRGLCVYIAAAEAAPDPTVSEVAADWLSACGRGLGGNQPLEPETITTYAGYVRNHIDPALGEREITSLTRKDVVQFRDETLKVVARITTKKILGALKSICAYAIDSEILHADPTLKIVVKLGGRHKAVVEIPTKKEMTGLVDKAFELAHAPGKERINKTWTRYSLMLELLVYCGLRLSEVRGLPRTALDFKRHTVSITQRADRRGRIGPPKSVRSRRTLYMPDRLSQRLKEWIQTHNHDLVFPSASGNPLLPENIRRRLWDRLLSLTSCSPYHLHSTRHFFASRLIESGATVKEVSTALGHADEGFTLETYGHLFMDDESERRRKDRANSLMLT